jgi:hypothetical protein
MAIEKTDLVIFLEVVGEDQKKEGSLGTMGIDLVIGTETSSLNRLLWWTMATDQLQFQD